MDYEQQLLNTIESFNVGFPVYTDTHSDKSSISVSALPSSTTIREYYDGIRDKVYDHEIQIKARVGERESATAALAQIGTRLDAIESIPSGNGSYSFGNIRVTNEMFFSDATTDGWVYFTMQVKSLLTIFQPDPEKETTTEKVEEENPNEED